jgi:hypothetical protein
VLFQPAVEVHIRLATTRYPYAQRAWDFELGGSGLKPPHRARYRALAFACHELKAGRGFKNPAQCRPKVKIFNLKVKEKDKEHSYTARLANGWEAIKSIESALAHVYEDVYERALT